MPLSKKKGGAGNHSKYRRAVLSSHNGNNYQTEVAPLFKQGRLHRPINARDALTKFPVLAWLKGYPSC